MSAPNTYQTMKNSTLRQVLVALATALLLLGGVGCEEARIVSDNNQESAQDPSSSDEKPSADQSDEQGNLDPGTPEHPAEEQPPSEPIPTDEHGHGATAEEREPVEPGYMNGSWRVASHEQDQPAVYFDTFQDEGTEKVTGTFLMGFAIYERLDGESGLIETGSFDGETLTILWNPTTDPEEMLTLQATRVDQNTLEGAVTAKRNTEMNIPVTITRQTGE